jgi:hypothetical protein
LLDESQVLNKRISRSQLVFDTEGRRREERQGKEGREKGGRREGGSTFAQ